jgi:aminoglycoside/choline kinase family phosphotransferase
LNTTHDPRQEAIQVWLTDLFNDKPFKLTAASNDASFRRYFRITTADNSFIVMDAPPDKEDTIPFINIASALFKHNIHVPEILAKDVESGFLLLTDFGSTAYLDKLHQDTADDLYQHAIHALVQMQAIDATKIAIPRYSETKVLEELTLFPEWFLGKHLGIQPPDFLSHTFKLLITNALDQPQVFVHRDYHSRNLMLPSESYPGIIDFQDAVIGPISYDLVSLLRDCYIEWPNDKVEQWLAYYFTLAQQQNLIDQHIDLARFARWFDLMGLQRHLKVLGIFCRLNYRDNKSNYLNDLPLTLNYVKAVCEQYDEFNDLALFLDKIEL